MRRFIGQVVAKGTKQFDPQRWVLIEAPTRQEGVIELLDRQGWPDDTGICEVVMADEKAPRHHTGTPLTVFSYTIARSDEF